ncbi:DNA excision repair protein [Nesidiocoris tenuis]|nr:DNA excision repair protein [Nesidiocoris tenuis]
MSPGGIADVKTAKDFCVNVSAIESVAKTQQASELQQLELDVFDHATLEKGIIAQVNEAIQNAAVNKDPSATDEPKEKGEIVDDLEEESDFAKKVRLGELTPFDQSEEGRSFQKKAQDGFNEALLKYMENQQRLQQSRKKKSENSPKKVQPPKPVVKRKNRAPKEFVDDPTQPVKGKGKKSSKGKFLGSSQTKRRKKEKLGSRKSRGRARSDTAPQPGEVNAANFDNESGSEYLPSDSEKSDDEAVPRSSKPIKKLLSTAARSDSDTDWDSSDDDTSKKRQGNKELDDGDPHYFTKRVKHIDRNEYLKELQVVLGEFKCPKIIWEKLYKYQQVAVKWFWELNQQRCGGILGDEMGLGKTIQIIAFLAGLYASDLYDYDTEYTGLGPTLIVCPTTVMHQWVREFHKWFPIVRVAILHESGTYTNTGKERTRLIDSIHSYHDHGILITSYSGMVQHSKKILDKQWHYVILDEGHKIRNHQAQVTVVAKKIDTPHRLILSGSPLQNNLRELWSLFDFIYPGKLGTLQVFTNVFHLPVVAGGYANASPSQVLQAYKCAVTLKTTIMPYLLRRMKCDVDAHIKLPPKTEQVLFCKLTEQQRQLYVDYLKDVSIEDMVRGSARLFVGLMNLRKICNHPDLFSGGPSNDFTLNDKQEGSPQDRFGYWERAGKMIVVKTLLKIWFEQKHRVLLFAQGQKMLLILEDFVKRSGYQYLKLDGTTSVSARQPLIDRFNQDSSYFVMLLTTKVGGLGVNLTGANRVVIYDPDWNPATDTQARERAWRIGQEKDVTIYRLVTAGTIEEKVYHRQIYKQFLSNKILKDPKQRRFFKSNELSELFTLSETVKGGTTETCAIFAGTGSEVNLAKLSSVKKPKYVAQEEAKDPKITFSDAKIEQMKKIAQLLSKRIASQISPTKVVDDEPKAGGSKDVEAVIEEVGSNVDIYGPDGQIVVEKAQKLKQPPTVSPISTKVSTGVDENENHTSPKRKRGESEAESSPRKKKHRRKTKRVKFEGHDVPNLVKCKKFKKDKDEEQEQNAATQDDYVLHKLFAKSGIATALRHDTIMEGGPHDYAIIEAEADKMAEEAIKAVKQSRAQIPTVRKPLVRSTIQGSDLLSAIRKRNMIVDTSDTENDLVKSLVTWLNSVGGVATTDEVVQEFSSKVDDGKSALFKSLLGKIAKFSRSKNTGYWTIKDEFKM